MTKNWNKSRFFYRLIAFYTLICLVPMTVFISFFYRQVIQENEKTQITDYKRSSEIIIEAVKTIDDELYSLTNQLKLTNWVKKLRSNSDILFNSIDQVRMQEICNDILLYESMLGISNQIGIYFPNRELVITRRGLLNARYLYQYFPVDLSVVEKANLHDLFKSVDQYGVYNLWESGIEHAGKNDLLVISPLDDIKNTRAIFYGYLSGEAIEKRLKLNSCENLIMFSISQDGNLIFLYEMDEKRASYTISSRVNMGQSVINCEMIFSETSGAPNLASFSLLFAAIILAVVFGMSASYLLAKLTYRPMAILLGKIGGNKIWEDFSYIEQSLEKLNEEKQDLSNRIQQYASVMHNQVLLSLLHGLFTLELDINGKVRLPLSDEYEYQVRVFHDADRIMGAKGFANALIKLHMTNLSAELIQNKGDWVLIFIAGNDQILTELFSQELGILDSYCGLPYIGILGISKSYNDLEIISRLTYFYPVDWEMQLINQVKNGDKVTAQRIIDQLKVENSKRGLTKDEINALHGAINNTLMRIARELNKQPEQFLNTLRSSTASDSWERYELLIGILCDGISANEHDKDSLGNEIINYVNAHFDDEALSLAKLQDVFGYSQPVISRVFKESASMPYYEYLSKLRLNKAKELLSETRYSISQIAMMVGYTNEATFQRAFKRYTGVTPRDYNTRK